MQKETCSKCRKPLASSRVGKQRYCKVCHAANMRAYRAKQKKMFERVDELEERIEMVEGFLIM